MVRFREFITRKIRDFSLATIKPEEYRRGDLKTNKNKSISRGPQTLRESISTSSLLYLT